MIDSLWESLALPLFFTVLGIGLAHAQQFYAKKKKKEDENPEDDVPELTGGVSDDTDPQKGALGQQGISFAMSPERESRATEVFRAGSGKDNAGRATEMSPSSPPNLNNTPHTGNLKDIRNASDSSVQKTPPGGSAAKSIAFVPSPNALGKSLSNATTSSNFSAGSKSAYIVPQPGGGASNSTKKRYSTRLMSILQPRPSHDMHRLDSDVSPSYHAKLTQFAGALNFENVNAIGDGKSPTATDPNRDSNGGSDAASSRGLKAYPAFSQCGARLPTVMDNENYVEEELDPDKRLIVAARRQADSFFLITKFLRTSEVKVSSIDIASRNAVNTCHELAKLFFVEIEEDISDSSDPTATNNFALLESMPMSAASMSSEKERLTPPASESMLVAKYESHVQGWMDSGVNTVFTIFTM